MEMVNVPPAGERRACSASRATSDGEAERKGAYAPSFRFRYCGLMARSFPLRSCAT